MKLIIGIDPDVDKSGVAVAEDGKIKSLECLTLHDLFFYLWSHKEVIKKVYLEAGWLNKKVNFHTNKNALSREKTAYHVGMNHCVGLLIEQELKEQGVNYELVRPTSAKRDHKEFCILTKWDKAILTNQEKRDAGMLITGIK